MSLSQTFAALSDPNRQKILDALKKREMPVSEIASYLNITLPTLSHHLDILKRAGLVSSRRDGQRIIYNLNLSVFEDVSEKIIKFFNLKK
ncbi:MAG: winged helix-turn-helix transcriptional regulator [Candidatus Doudnabacteria bacterium]|nr:winged helix-turn-helix transcriptional regulator [Candidatus Doudnabacteria bacterium]